MCPTLWIEVPQWWTENCEGSPLLGGMTRWIFTYFTIWIQALLYTESPMRSIWGIAFREFAVFTVAPFIEAAKFGIEMHAKSDPVCHRCGPFGVVSFWGFPTVFEVASHRKKSLRCCMSVSLTWSVLFTLTCSRSRFGGMKLAVVVISVARVRYL